MILIISHQKDAHNIAIKDKLNAIKYPYKELDLSKFPKSSQLSLHYDAHKFQYAEMQMEDATIPFEKCGAIWWRRPQPFTVHEEVSAPDDMQFVMNESYCAINGLWMLTDAYWINHPINDDIASRKAYQLKVAATCGLTIPKTLITNNPANAKKFISELGMQNVIYKSFWATEKAWRETRLIKEDELTKLDTVKYAPVIFQECIHADIDLRITVIGDHIFPAAIYSQETSYKIDFRMNYHEAKIVEHPLPEELNAKLLKFMRSMGITYGAIDLRMRPNGEYVFLEVNTAGQWLFMEQPTGMPITETLAQTLIEFDQLYAEKKHGVREKNPA